MLVSSTSPSSLSIPKKNILKSAVDTHNTKLKVVKKKKKNFLYKCIMTNTSAIWQQAVHITQHHILAVQRHIVTVTPHSLTVYKCQ